MRCCMRTDSSGYIPAALSALSMIASGCPGGVWAGVGGKGGAPGSSNADGSGQSEHNIRVRPERTRAGQNIFFSRAYEKSTSEPDERASEHTHPRGPSFPPHLPAPSYIAVAASLASALVGVGLSIMLSSICVATTTGLPCLLHSSMMVFCSIGTSSGAHSTPRSPRATTETGRPGVRWREEEEEEETRGRRGGVTVSRRGGKPIRNAAVRPGGGDRSRNRGG